MTDHRSPKVHRDPPEAPVPWFDPDPLTVEPEPVSELAELEAAWSSMLVRAALAALLLVLLLFGAAALWGRTG